MDNNLMLEQIHSIPDLMRHYLPKLESTVRAAVTPDFARSLEQIYLCGCGDSHHAALASQMSFETLAMVPAQALTSMQFARYTAPNLPREKTSSILVIAISVSGEVARSIESLLLSRAAGAHTLAVTASPLSRLAGAAQDTLFTPSPDPPPASDLPVPGSTSYILNQLVLYLLAIVLGELRGVLSSDQSISSLDELQNMAGATSQTIQNCSKTARNMAESWLDENEYVFAGAGPNYAAALFSAAKLLEASGDSAVGQDLEEWAHLQYFARNPSTPTIVISAGGYDLSRAVEIIQAARGIKRQVAAFTPQNVADMAGGVEFCLSLPGEMPEVFSSLVTCIPGALFAAHRAELLGEPYFRAFCGGRNPEGGGGLSRIQTSHILEDFTSFAESSE